MAYPNSNDRKKEIQKRDKEIFKLRQQGKMLKQIALRYNISLTRASQIYLREKDRHDNLDKWPPLKQMLSTRTQTCLVNYFEYHGYENILNNPQKIAELNGKSLLRIKNLGKKSVTELLNALHELGYIEPRSL